MERVCLSQAAAHLGQTDVEAFKVEAEVAGSLKGPSAVQIEAHPCLYAE